MSTKIKIEMSIFVLHSHVYLHAYPKGDQQAKQII